MLCDSTYCQPFRRGRRICSPYTNAATKAGTVDPLSTLVPVGQRTQILLNTVAAAFSRRRGEGGDKHTCTTPPSAVVSCGTESARLSKRRSLLYACLCVSAYTSADEIEREKEKQKEIDGAGREVRRRRERKKAKKKREQPSATNVLRGFRIRVTGALSQVNEKPSAACSFNHGSTASTTTSINQIRHKLPHKHQAHTPTSTHRYIQYINTHKAHIQTSSSFQCSSWGKVIQQYCAHNLVEKLTVITRYFWSRREIIST